MKAYCQANKVDEVLRLFHEMIESQCKPNIICFNTVLNSLVTATRFSEAGSLLDSMVSLELNPNISTFNILVKAYSCCSDQFDSAYMVIEDWMVNSGVSPDVTTFSTLISGLCKGGRICEAHGVLNRMLKEKVGPNIFTFTPILHALYGKRMIKEGSCLIGFMLKWGCPLNTVVYNILIDGLCKNSDFDRVKIMLERSTSIGWKPNSISYNIYMNGLCKVGRVMDAFGLLEVMKKDGLSPTSFTVNILLDCLCQASMVDEAKNLLGQSSWLKWEVDTVSYNTLMSRYSSTRDWKAVLKLFAAMLKKGLEPNSRTYNIVINCLCIAGELMYAKSLICKGWFRADLVTYNILIDAFYRSRNTVQVQDLYERMKQEKIAEDVYTVTVKINNLCKAGEPSEASKFLFELMKMGFTPDLVTYSALIDGLAKHGKLRDKFFSSIGRQNREITGSSGQAVNAGELVFVSNKYISISQNNGDFIW
ncbi:hypothetical protein H6P81_002440 [Aristolochia fimbriata]|uniref:Pentatricopeptide repeat-containing protein n=1 Tax=Aristolochia fimbriata TaxID=158543 RepID=A0AAV7FCZ6_ARIFI|nr:hypothetical protein H6P81_002440 [Aristolochia fimbriata]